MGMSRGWVRCRLGGFSLEADWSVEAGRVLVLFGPSGAGKTTTLRAIAGLIRPEQGRVEIGGQVVYDSATGVWVPAHRRRLGYLTQRYHLFPHLTVAGNIAYGLTNRTSTRSAERVQQLVRALHLNGLEERRTWQLSGGEQQRVALARVLAPEPELLLLDEPFASLDLELRRILRRELRSMLAASPIPVILVTHDREEALAQGHSVQIINNGQISEPGEPLRVLGQPGLGEVARLVGVENLLTMRVERRNPQDGTMDCRSGEVRLEVPLDSATPGVNNHVDRDDQVTVGIRSSDIILASEEPRGSSARNRLRGTVVSVELRPPGYEVTLDCGLLLRAQITGAALTEMGIKPGLPLWAVFKASSCFLVQDEVPAQAPTETDA